MMSDRILFETNWLDSNATCGKCLLFAANACYQLDGTSNCVDAFLDQTLRDDRSRSAQVAGRLEIHFKRPAASAVGSQKLAVLKRCDANTFG